MKTLKDIDKKQQETEYCNCTYVIRNAAKEWIKELKFRQNYNNELISHSKNSLLSSIDFIKHFFNLEEKND